MSAKHSSLSNFFLHIIVVMDNISGYRSKGKPDKLKSGVSIRVEKWRASSKLGTDNEQSERKIYSKTR